MQKDLVTRIKELAEPVVVQQDMYLLDIEVNQGNEMVIWVYVDSEKGEVNIEFCSLVSRELGFLMEAHDLLPGGYRLNVSSPGLSRPLTDKRQYVKNCGRKARIKFRDNEGYHTVTGIIRQVSGDQLEVVAAGGKEEVIEFGQLVETTIIPTFDR